MLKKVQNEKCKIKSRETDEQSDEQSKRENPRWTLQERKLRKNIARQKNAHRNSTTEKAKDTGRVHNRGKCKIIGTRATVQ
jgi:hypothetical protein